MVNVRDVVALRAIDEGLNAFAIEGGATTLRVAVLLVVPVPPSLELTAPVVFSLLPAVVPVTSTLIAHVLLAATVPALRLTVVAPAGAVNAPPHVLLGLGTVAT